MAFEFRLPDVGEGLHEAEILGWKVKEGDEVTEDQPLVEVQTDKAAVELTSPVTGKVAKLSGKPGEIIAVGTVIAVFDTGDGAAVAAAPSAAAVDKAAAARPADPEVKAPAALQADTAPAQAARPAAPAAAPIAAAPVEGRRALATPAVRRVARELGVDIDRVPGTGSAGRVTAEDVQNFARGGAAGAEEAAAPAAPAPTAAPAETPAARPAAPAAQPGERVPLRGIRRKIAEAMVRSKHTAPHVTTVDEADMTELVAMREKAKALAEQRDIKLTYLPFIIKALVLALKEFPYLNARLDDEAQEIILHSEYNIGIATDTDSGLVVPVIKHADQKSIFTLAGEIATLSDKARKGKLSLDDIRGGTFSITNQGSVGGLFFTPIINWPEVAILGVSQIQERPVVRDGQVVVRKMTYMVLSFDHRVIDGATATRFLARVVGYLSNPTLLMMEMM